MLNFRTEMFYRIKADGGILVNKKIKTEAVDFLFDAILHLKDRSECYSFFEDLCTVNELLSLSQRFEVVKTILEFQQKTQG